MASSSSKTAGLFTGLSLGLLMTLAFFGLGYSLNLSIVFGGIASICGYCLGSWWQLDQVPSSSEKSPFEPLEKGVTKILLKTKLIDPNSKTSQRPTHALSVFEWIFRKNKAPRSRR